MRALFFTFFTILAFTRPSNAERLELYLDADFSVSFAAAEAIALGIDTALAEVDYVLGGVPISVVNMDHRGNGLRSHRTMQTYLKSDRALALIGGLHSPPYIKYRDYMNENAVLTLLPWSAGAPITRSAPETENWIFRLSVDDSKSGEFFVQQAREQGGCASVALVMLDTAWGVAGEAAISTALAQRNDRPATVQFFPFAVGAAAAGVLANEVAASGADCAILMANATNGATIVQALNANAPHLRIFSHWGIMGAAFQDAVPHDMRSAHDLKVLQTCALRIEATGSVVLQAALSAGVPDAQGLSDVGAVTGFVHGYDLTRVLIAAADQAAQTTAWNGTITDRRTAVKDALENLQAPVDGILKRYDRPFRNYGPNDKDAHEALGLDDLCLARFGADGRLEDAG